MNALRESLEAAFDEHAEEDPQGEVIAKEKPDAGSQEEAGTGDAADLGQQADTDVTKLASERPAKAAKSGANQEQLPADGTPAQTGQPKVVDPQSDANQQQTQQNQQQAIRAPVSWKPELRAEFASLKPAVQAEIQRREVEIDRTLRQTSQERQYAGRLHQTIAPYEAMIRAEGGDHFTAVDTLLKTAYHLRTANPQNKAALVAQMIMQHGVDVNLLDASLSQIVKGGGQPQAQDPMMHYIQQQLAPVQQFVQQIGSRQQQLQQEQAQNAVSEIEVFGADPKNEYFHDVREIMADFLEAAASRGQKMSLSEAYQRATLAHPTISTLVMNRQMSVTAAQRNAAVKRARNATASLPSGGGTSSGAADGAQTPKNLRSAIEAAWEATEQRED